MVEHSLDVYDCFEKLQLGFPEIEVSNESKAIVTLMHDLCKINFYVKERKSRKTGRLLPNGKPEWEDYFGYSVEDKLPLGHGEKSVIILQSFIKLTRDEIYAIRWHMGSFDSAVKGGDYGMGNAYEICPVAALLHLSDMAATYLVDNKNIKKEVESY